MRTLRAYFLTRLLREKLLLVVLMAFGALWWLSAFSTRMNAFSTQQRRTTSALKEQQQWLDHRKEIELSAEKAAAKLDPAKTLDGSRLLAVVNNLAREAGLRSTVSGGLTQQSNGQFSVHTLDYTVNRAEWDPLTKFYSALQQQSPYIGIERVMLTADATGVQHSLSLRVSSVEISR